MLSYEQIKEQNQAGEFWAIGDDGKKYAATYSPEYKNMFFCIPYGVEILGYIEKEQQPRGREIILKYYAEKYGATITKDENGGTVALFNQATAGERLKAFENFFTAISKYIDAKSGIYGDKIAVYLSI